MRNKVRHLITASCLIVAVAIAAVTFRRDPPSTTDDSTAVFPKRTSGGFVTSDVCLACHPDQHASWHRSFHRTMTQEANAETIVASFDDVKLSTGGQTATLQRRGDEFWVNFVDPAWERSMFRQWNASRDDNAADPFSRYQGEPPRIDARVIMTTGSHHFQVYWIRGAVGRELWQFPWRYHIAEARWVHRKDVFLTPPDWKPGMWFRVWNDQCSLCHSTGPQPGQNLESGVMEDTRVAELGIACESCHGPGASHIALHREGSVAKPGLTDTIVNPAKLSHRRSAEICGACHSHFQHRDPMLTVHGSGFRPGDNLNHFGSLIDPPTSPEVMTRFWGDGTNRSGGREFSGMSASQCYLKGDLSCVHCHSMHESSPDDQLAPHAQTDEACLQCHEDLRPKLLEHTHHRAGSSGSQCYNCHMPHTNYALYKSIRSHQIDIPRVAPIQSNSRPNACNLCHLDQTLQWTSNQLQEWYDIQPAELSEDEQAISAAVLWSLRGDAGQRVIVAWHLGWSVAREVSSTQWMAPVLAELMRDPYAAVRWVAYQSLQTEATFSDIAYAFDDTVENRQLAADAIVRRWKELPRSRVPTQPHRVLLDQHGDLDMRRVQQLLRKRDQRNIAGVE